MPTLFDANAQDVGRSLDVIEDEIEAGLSMQTDRLVAAFDNEEYLAGRNVGYIPRREGEDWRDYVKRPKRTSKLTQRVINTLAAGLYNPGPTRELKGNASANTFLQHLYEQCHVNALMKQADRKANLNGFVAIQAHATGRPEKPISLYLWAAHEIVVYTWPDDPCEAWAIVTITRQRQTAGSTLEQRVKYDAWSRDEHRAYLSRWKPVPNAIEYAAQQYRSLFGEPARYQGDMSGEPPGSGKNPYGILPFVFAHDEPIVTDFYEGGLGCALRECNAEVDRELSDLAQHSREFMDPDRFLHGVAPGWRREKRAGQWQHLTPGRGVDEGINTRAELVQPMLNTELVWFNIQKYADMTLEDLGVPLAAVRMDASTDLSGIAIVAKHIPLLERTRQRQPQFTEVESDLASVVLHVAGSAYSQGVLLSASVEPELEVIWPSPRFPLPTPERDLEDAWEMNEGVKSLVDVVGERMGLTADGAKEHIERVAEDNKWLQTVLPPRADPNNPNNPQNPNNPNQPPKDETEQQDTEE